MIRYIFSLVLLPFLFLLSLIIVLRNKIVTTLIFSPHRLSLKNLNKNIITNSDLVVHYSFECLVNYVEVSLTNVFFYHGLYLEPKYKEKYGSVRYVDVLKFTIFGQLRSKRIGMSVMNYYIDLIKETRESQNQTYLEKIRDLYVWWTEKRTIVNYASVATLEEQLNLIQQEVKSDSEKLAALFEIRPFLIP